MQVFEISTLEGLLLFCYKEELEEVRIKVLRSLSVIPSLYLSIFYASIESYPKLQISFYILKI